MRIKTKVLVRDHLRGKGRRRPRVHKQSAVLVEHEKEKRIRSACGRQNWGNPINPRRFRQHEYMNTAYSLYNYKCIAAPGPSPQADFRATRTWKFAIDNSKKCAYRLSLSTFLDRETRYIYL